MTQLSNAGIPFPLPLDYDYEGRMEQPPDIIPPAKMDLKTRNEDNTLAETHNRASTRATRIYMAATDKTGLDVGLNLSAYWLYSTSDIESMVKSTRICDAVGPIPTYLCLMIENARFQRAEADDAEKRNRENQRADREKLRAEKEKDKATPVLGSMVMSNPVVRTPALCEPVIVPEIVLLTIFHRLHPPINWFTDDRLQFAEQHAPEKVTVLDIAKMIVMWGNDENHTCLSALDWQQATLNFLAALVQLCPPPSNPPVKNFAEEFKNHRGFFMKLKNFERDYPIWYPFEREMRGQILNSADSAELVPGCAGSGQVNITAPRL
ncbi:hypothetical protein B0H11DRAFT_1944098 [Mycena galericulata]|nr:hypothetical protein B0H11DRAFT_1944098 [Mycena galericulata]